MVQSNEISIEQMDLTIARFMGMEGSYDFIRQNYQYHKSWDILMPCWARFREVVSDYFDEDYPAEYCSMCDVWALYCEHVNINGAHKLLYDAITWFNECQNELLNRDYNRVIATEFKNKP